MSSQKLARRKARNKELKEARAGNPDYIMVDWNEAVKLVLEKVARMERI